MADLLESESAAALLTFKNGGFEGSIKQEELQLGPDAEDDGCGPPRLRPEMLGLKRTGDDSPLPQRQNNNTGLILNRRGTPARIRKKNRLFFDDDIVSLPTSRATPKKAAARGTPKKIKIEVAPVIFSPDKKVAQKIGVRLRNLLKLPKAHKWVCYEWFYSNIDKPLFEGDNDFMVCLRDSFPQLKTRKLARVEWCKIRRLMGKPRRCSQLFFEEERRELDRKRQKIRMLQQRKAADMTHYRDLPAEIPLQLVIGTKVTSRLRRPQDGLFTGSIDAVDTSNNTYRVTFDRQGLGTHSIPDYEILSNETPDTILVSSLAQKFRPRPQGPFAMSPALMSEGSSPHLSNDPLLAGSPMKNKCPPPDGMLGGFPVEFLETVVRLSRLLSEKKKKIICLNEMNADAERIRSFGEVFTEDFQRRYASVVIELDEINSELKNYLSKVQQFCQEVAPEPSLAAMLAPQHLRETCLEEAQELIGRFNRTPDRSRELVSSQRAVSLVTGLTALLLQVKSLADVDRSAYELKVLRESLQEIKTNLDERNRPLFQAAVELHMQHIENGLSQLGSLHQFTIKHPS